MNKLDRKYITLNAVNGNIDAYCSVSFDFSGAKEKVSLSVNGESCETQSFYVVVKEGASFLAFYLGDLNKKADNKFEFKKEGCKLGSTIYTLKDVVAVQIVDNIYKQVLYDGIVDDSMGYKGSYTVVVDKPVVARLEDVDNVQNGDTRAVGEEDKQDKQEVDELEQVEENIRKEEKLEEVEENTREEEKLEEVEENTREEKGLEEVEENTREEKLEEVEGNTREGKELEEVEENTREEKELEEVEENTREEKELEEVEENTREENELEEVEENTREENELEEVEENTREENELYNDDAFLTNNDLMSDSDDVNYNRSLEDRLNKICNSKTKFDDLVDVEQCEMEYTSQDVADAKCESCEYKLFYNSYERQVNEINDDFQVFNELYSKYLKNEFNKNYKTINKIEERDDNNYRYINELDNNRFNGNIEFKNYQNFVEFERLKPDTQTRDSDTKIVNATFRNAVDKSNEDEKGNSTDFYQQLIGDDKNKKSGRKNNKNTSFVDILNYVKHEFDSIKEIMSLSDEEFAKRSEQEFKKEKDIKPNNINSGKARNIGKITNIRSLIDERVEFKPFEMENHCVKWVQIKLNEVVGFFDNYWKLFWEEFVVDAYKEHRHLLLGVEEVDGSEGYFFAVPAVYNKENVDKAYELGFEYFEVVGDNFGEITDGVNGYFIKELKQNENFDDENDEDEYSENQDAENQNDLKVDDKSVDNKSEIYTYGTKSNINTNQNVTEENIVNDSINPNEISKDGDKTITNNDSNGDNSNINQDYDNLDDVETENMNSK